MFNYFDNFNSSLDILSAIFVIRNDFKNFKVVQSNKPQIITLKILINYSTNIFYIICSMILFLW